MLDQDIMKSFQNDVGNVSIVLKDLKNDALMFQLDPHRVVASASTIKILIMIEALRQIMEQRLSFDELVEVKDEDKVDFSIITELNVKHYSIKDLITLMIITSDNTATNILIDILGYGNINKMAEDLKLEGTVLRRKMMDFEAAKQGKQNVTTAWDMAVMMEALYKGTILDESMCQVALDILKRQQHKDLLTRYIADDIVVANKTGDLQNLNHDIGIFYHPYTDYLLGVFVTDAESNIGAKHIIGKVSKTVYDYFSNKMSSLK
ncbi:serine hydrolase [Lutispora thermophila]|uniref:Beta-lactamase class A n=1 Tax=Lutispora thermophila DSM 19022 TaxID=1122184 RepID=A0A1M6FJQ9_9FIRM|nr:serine hydrolase [Lutispora thermophila]SHI97915.1 beta-lactamase class A [Lutispora thermophila DSM 19022]